MWVFEKGRSGMNYQEALRRIIDEYIPMHYEGKPMNQQTEDALLLQALVNEKLEQESRKDYLIVGSQWECVANCYYESYGDALKIQKGEVTKITSYHNHTLAITRGIMPTQQFLLCFKPIDKREQLKDVHSDTI
jgi:hypothetical protein